MKMKKRILEMLLCDFDVSKGRVSIFRLNSAVPRYQVLSEDFRHPYCQTYDELEMEIAVDKFLLILNLIKDKSDKSKKRVDAV